LWDSKIVKKSKFSNIPSALVAVVLGTAFSFMLKYFGLSYMLEPKHLVSLPISDSFDNFLENFSLPDFANGIRTTSVWVAAVTIAIVASLESLLSIEATDKLDPQRRITPLNRELFAQGFGNIISGSIGGLPITAVIVRSSANIMAGAQTKIAAISHGLLLLISVMFFPHFLNTIPLSSLAVILIFTGFKLAKPSIFKDVYAKGLDSFVPFIVTIIAIILSDLLKGIIVGIFVGMIFVFRSNIKLSVLITRDGKNFLVRFIKDVTFFNKAHLRNFLQTVPDESNVIIDMRKPVFVDDDILEIINEYKVTASTKRINLEVLHDTHSNFNDTSKNI
jgi:MFS superfamily sulfate permease-like transporter